VAAGATLGRMISLLLRPGLGHHNTTCTEFAKPSLPVSGDGGFFIF
jgi:hypothetical protein